MTKLWVTIPELCIAPDLVLTIQEAVTLQEFSNELSICRGQIGEPVRVSQKSGIRTRDYELAKGRSGNSEHATYNIPNRGAVDLMYSNNLFAKLVERRFFTRICYYPNNGFMHCDRKPHDNPGRIQYFEAASASGSWSFKKLL